MGMSLTWACCQPSRLSNRTLPRGANLKRQTKGSQRCVDRRSRDATQRGQNQYFSSAGRSAQAWMRFCLHQPPPQSSRQPPNYYAHHSIAMSHSCNSIRPMHFTAAAPRIPDPVLTRWTPVVDVDRPSYSMNTGDSITPRGLAHRQLIMAGNSNQRPTPLGNGHYWYVYTLTLPVRVPVSSLLPSSTQGHDQPGWAAETDVDTCDQPCGSHGHWNTLSLYCEPVITRPGSRVYRVP